MEPRAFEIMNKDIFPSCIQMKAQEKEPCKRFRWLVHNTCAQRNWALPKLLSNLTLPQPTIQFSLQGWLRPHIYPYSSFVPFSSNGSFLHPIIHTNIPKRATWCQKAIAKFLQGFVIAQSILQGQNLRSFMGHNAWIIALLIRGIQSVMSKLWLSKCT